MGQDLIKPESDVLKLIEKMGAFIDHLKQEGYFTHSPQILTLPEFCTLPGFDLQVSDIPSVEYEWIKQDAGGGVTGDIYHGTMAIRLNARYFFLLDY